MIIEIKNGKKKFRIHSGGDDLMEKKGVRLNRAKLSLK